MRATFLVSFAFLVACSGASASVGDDPTGGGDKSSSGGGGGGSSGNGGSSGAAGASCPATTKSGSPQKIGEGPPAPIPRPHVVFDIVNKSGATLYVVNDDDEHEMVDVSGSGAMLRLAPPPLMVCGSTLTAIHTSRFVYAIAPGATRSAGGWDETMLTDGGKVCFSCASYGRPDLGIQMVDELSPVDAPPGEYTATVKVMTALPAGCAPAADGFTCPSWPGVAALSATIRSSQVSLSVASENPVGQADVHLTVPF